MAEPNSHRLILKEKLLLIIATPLALASLVPDDPWVCISMLIVSGIAFVSLCKWHAGGWIPRTVTAVILVGILVFVGRRDLRHSQGAQKKPTAPAHIDLPSIQQKSTDSPCSNIVSGGNTNVTCPPPGKKK